MEDFEMDEGNDDLIETGSAYDDVYVQALDASTYQKLVYEDKVSLFVKFYAPWCGHCQHLAPDWNELGAEMEGADVKIAAIDCTDEESGNNRLCTDLGIEGFPTLKLVDATARKIIDYSGERSVREMKVFASGAYASADGIQFREDQTFVTRAMGFLGSINTAVVGPIMEFNPYILVIPPSFPSTIQRLKLLTHLHTRGPDCYSFLILFLFFFSSFP